MAQAELVRDHQEGVGQEDMDHHVTGACLESLPPQTIATQITKHYLMWLIEQLVQHHYVRRAILQHVAWGA